MARRIDIATCDLVPPIEVIPVSAVVKENARLVVAVDQRNRKSRSNLLNQRQLPIPQQRIRHAAPVVAKFLATAERQVVQNARREFIRQVDLRPSPVEILPVWQREVGRAGK